MAALPTPAAGPRQSAVDAAALERALRAAVRGEVRFDAASRALYAVDGSIYRQPPLGVVLPRRIEDIVAAVAVCRRHGAPIVMRGGGTSLAGQTCNAAVVLDTSKHLNRILSLDARRRTAWVEPGLVLDDLRQAAEAHHLTFAPDPATHNRCTLGGMIGNNSCGVHSLLGGKTVDNVEELEIVTYDGARFLAGSTSDRELERVIARGGRQGEIYAALRDIRDRYGEHVRREYPKIPRRVSGYNLDQLLPENGFHVARALVGSESTCAIVLRAKLRLVPSPRLRPLLALGFRDVGAAADAVPEVLGTEPIGLEGFDDELLVYLRSRGALAESIALLPEGRGWLLSEYGAGSRAEAEAITQRAMTRLRRAAAPAMRLYWPPENEAVWKIREAAVGVTSFTPQGKVAWPGWEDSAVPPEKLGVYIRQLRALLDRFGYRASIFGHFGQACLHMRIDFNLRTAAGIRDYRRFMEEAADLVAALGGSLSGEHGDGQARAELLPKIFSHELIRGLEAFKRAWDPENRLNPGKMVNAFRLDENLRLGESYRPRPVATHFQFPDDKGSFAAAALRCSGLGECRRHDHGVMCPSYMVTREEMHSTRGRAHLLWEMLNGDLIRGGWRDAGVRESLDLCLACKGCRSDCPVNVDMASYKAEFLAHYYAGRPRPRSAYALGLIGEWAQWAGRAPRLANLATQVPPARGAAKLAAGIALRRPLPAFAARSLRAWYDAEWRRRPKDAAARRVLLWPDTFVNFFQPTVGAAAVRVLAAAGCEVELPPAALCCGRPLYDFGLLGRAKRYLRRVVAALADDIDAGTPLIVLEPSCAAVFRDEAVNLFPHDERVRRLRRQTFTLAEWLARGLPDYQPPRLAGRAVIHGHCHHKAVLNWSEEEKLLRATGLACEFLDSGCCGMAGSFGYEARHSEISRRVGERRLLPAVRAAARDALIVADGFSCREQIQQLTRRRALHLAQVLDLALHARAPGTLPERAYPETAADPWPLAVPLAAAAVGLGVWAARRGQS